MFTRFIFLWQAEWRMQWVFGLLVIEHIHTAVLATKELKTSWFFWNSSAQETSSCSFIIWEDDSGQICSTSNSCFVYFSWHTWAGKSRKVITCMLILFSQGFRSSPSSANIAVSVDVVRQVEAKYPALLFKQQLTAYVEKIYGIIRDNLKKDLTSLLSLCIQVILLYVD